MDVAETAPPESPRRQASPPRMLATVAVVFLIVFLFIRVGFVEPFGVPTGSMAPTLIGNHREGPCPRCGYPVRVGIPSGDRGGFFSSVPCPNCNKRVNLSEARDINGDRLLVDKNVYQLRRPRRWEVAVFRCVADLAKPYVKRIVGLPGEEITIVDGDAYANGELLRKSIREVREARFPVFALSFTPTPMGWGPRWLVYPPDADRRLPRDGGREPAPADDSVLVDGTLVLDAAGGPQQEVRLEYRHWNLDDNREEAVRSANSYDGGVRRESNIYPVHDFYFRCEVEVVSAQPEATFACRLFDGQDAVAAEVGVGKKADGKVKLAHEKLGILSSAGKVGLEPGNTYTVEFAFVDRRATLAIDGKVVVPPSDLPAEKKRGEVRRPLQLGARGCKLVLKRMTLDRDVHYTQAGKNGTRTPAQLGPDEYFMLGDNSGNSQDSREWPEPGVAESDFIGKPFLIHQPLRSGGVSFGGRDRTYQTLDWSRLRWVH